MLRSDAVQVEVAVGASRRGRGLKAGDAGRLKRKTTDVFEARADVDRGESRPPPALTLLPRAYRVVLTASTVQ